MQLLLLHINHNLKVLYEEKLYFDFLHHFLNEKPLIFETLPSGYIYELAPWLKFLSAWDNQVQLLVRF